MWSILRVSSMKPARHKPFTAYLSGGIQYAKRNGADWRREMSEWLSQVLGHAVIDPVRESARLKSRMRRRGYRLHGTHRSGGDWPVFFRRIVDVDSRFVQEKSDYVVCLWDASAKRGAGTQGELTLARFNRIPVFLVSKTPIETLPGWIQGCVTRYFPNFLALKIYLIQRYYRSV